MYKPINHSPLKLLAWRLAYRHWTRRIARRAEPLDVLSLGRVVVISPHQDDETIACGALLATLAAAKKTPQVVFVTDGANSHQGHPTFNPSALVALRRSEALTALAALGLSGAQMHELGAPDGEMQAFAAGRGTYFSAKLASLLDGLEPDTVLIPFCQEGTLDHEAVNALCLEALALTVRKPAVLQFVVWAKWSDRGRKLLLNVPEKLYYLPLGEHAAVKNKALDAHASQVHPSPPWNFSVLEERFVELARVDAELFVAFAPATSTSA